VGRGKASGQPPIRDLALIGDTRSAALTSWRGSVEWLCLPAFDGEPVFDSLLDTGRGGRFTIAPERAHRLERRYRADSVVLETSWSTARGRVRLTEGMVTDPSGRLLPDNLLVRRLEAIGAPCRVGVVFDPRRGLPGRPPRVDRRRGATIFSWGSVAFALTSSHPIDPGESTVRVEPGRPLTTVVAHVHRGPQISVSPDYAWALLDETDRDWKRWADGIRYDGPHRDAVVRSLITLRLLTFSPSGAPVAAPTTSLPEVMGGERNWDYRYSWPRDACIGLNAFIALGKDEKAQSFMRWLLHATRLSRPRIGVLYNAYGKTPPDESAISEVSGYQQSLPVRVSNGAATQLQLDVYGWVLDAASVMTGRGHHHGGSMWRALASFADFLASSWQEPDAGIWEERGEARHHVHSKLMAWLGLDRACAMAGEHGTRPRRRDRWLAARDALGAEIRSRGFDERRGAYTRAYGSSDLDASILLLPLIGLEDATSNRVVSTIRAVRDELGAGGALLYRYAPGSDGLSGREGAFLPVCFWLVQALARTGAVDEATELLDELCSLANDVGLYAEEIDPANGEHLGNFPQAFTHAALIQAALAIAEATSAR
jgi:GH15 family glucan-1,4-alpha-glucosidase